MTAVALLLVACSREQPEPPQNLAQTRPPAEQAPQAPPVEHVACARDDAALTNACTLDRARTAGGETWTIRFPDGAFRRLVVKGDEVSEADGAEPLVADGDAVRIGRERYRLPAR
jgi:hypothetical protein